MCAHVHVHLHSHAFVCFEKYDLGPAVKLSMVFNLEQILVWLINFNKGQVSSKCAQPEWNCYMSEQADTVKLI
jgi:hypothetical protein